MSWPGLTTGGNPWRLLGVAGSGAPPLIHGGGLAMSATCHNALGSSLGSTQMVLYEQLQSGKKEIRLLLANLSKIAGGSKPVSVPLQSGLALTASVGDWGVLSDGTTFFCATLAGEGIALWTQSKGHKPNGYTKALIHTGTRSALGRCRAVGSGKSFITAYTVTAKPYAELDLGPGAPDMGVKGVGYGEPTARVLPPSGNQISPPLRLSHRGGNLLLQDLIWDGSRFLALVNAVDQRGGRLLLTALDETGRLILRDLEIPLAYEPGRLLAGKLTADANGYTLLYASRRPWDAGVLHLVRFSVKW